MRYNQLRSSFLHLMSQQYKSGMSRNETILIFLGNGGGCLFIKYKIEWDNINIYVLEENKISNLFDKQEFLGSYIECMINILKIKNIFFNI